MLINLVYLLKIRHIFTRKRLNVAKLFVVASQRFSFHSTDVINYCPQTIRKIENYIEGKSIIGATSRNYTLIASSVNGSSQGSGPTLDCHTKL